MKAVIDLGKVGLTFGGVWQTGKNYEKLTFVLNKLSNGGDGCGYIAIEDSNSVRPDTDPTRWQKASEVGESIYDLCVARGYQGTEDQFVAEYNAAVAAANAAAASASAVEAQVAAAEALRVSAENGRVQAEASRAAAEQSRRSAEDARVAAENARVAADNLRQQTFERQSAEMTTAIGLAETATSDANAATEAANAAAASANSAAVAANAAAEAASSIETRLVNGSLVPAKAGNLESWEERDALNVSDDWTDLIRTTAGYQSVDSSKGARLISIIAQEDFGATAFKTTGFNLLHGATAVGAGYYFPVPALPFGSFGTASQPNGVLFTDRQGGKLTPTVKFKAFSAGVPSSVNDGVNCPTTDSNGYRFYNPAAPGWLIVSGITLADTCAHVAWSRRYDEFVAPDDDQDAGSVINIADVIYAVHTDVEKLLVVGSGAGLVSDRIDFDGVKAVWTRKVGRAKPTWTRGELDAETGLYPYTATVSSIKAGGLAEFEGANKPAISVDGTTLTYYSESDTADTAYVKFELATTATGNVSLSNQLTIEDWGLEILVGASGSAVVTTQYAQSYPDALAQLLANIDQSTVPVICNTFAKMQAEIDGLKAALYEATNLLKLAALRVDSKEFFVCGLPRVLRSKVAGAPSAANVPDNWDPTTMGVWTGVPRSTEQIYMDQASKKVYAAPVLTNSTNDWVVLN